MGYNPLLLYFIVQIVLGLAIGSSFSWHTLILYGILYACVCLVNFFKEPGFFYWRIEFKTKIGVLGVIFATGH